MIVAFLRILLWAHWKIISLLDRIGPPIRKPGGDGFDVLLTGTFYSERWILTHLKPLSLSSECRRILVVTAFPIPSLPKVETIPPSPFLVRMFGTVPARLFTFLAVALRIRPHVVGGFHLLLNGLAASLVAKACGARSLYFCVGGPAEVEGGGILSENRLFGMLKEPNSRVESMLLRATTRFDLIVTMGTGAKRYFREKGVKCGIQVVPGGIDEPLFSIRDAAPAWDVVFVGRLAPIKCVEILLRALKIVKEEIGGIKAVIVGDGILRNELETLSWGLDLAGGVEFAGYRTDVPSILSRSKVFVLTSQTEGLSLALMEAMAAGLPSVVSDVGDLGDIVRNGENGFLVAERTPEKFAERIAAILKDPTLCKRFGKAARAAMEKRDAGSAAGEWNAVLGEWRHGAAMRFEERCAE